MLLARRGYRVSLVDRTTFPSDTIYTHWIWQLGTACLQLGRWDWIWARCQLIGEPPAPDGVAEICVPRRTVLDKILVDAAAEAARR